MKRLCPPKDKNSLLEIEIINTSEKDISFG